MSTNIFSKGVIEAWKDWKSSTKKGQVLHAQSFMQGYRRGRKNGMKDFGEPLMGTIGPSGSMFRIMYPTGVFASDKGDALNQLPSGTPIVYLQVLPAIAKLQSPTTPEEVEHFLKVCDSCNCNIIKMP